MSAVPPPLGDRAQRIRTTVPCPPGHVIGQLADLVSWTGPGSVSLVGIGQLADGPGRPRRDDGNVEIRIVLDRAEPPAGRLRVVHAPGQAPGPRAGQEICFSGWLGLLRALYEVTAEPGKGPGPEP